VYTTGADMSLNIRSKRKGMIERCMQRVIEVLGRLAGIVLSADDFGGPAEKLDLILGIQVEFDTIFQEFKDQLGNRFYAPFYWEDLYSIGVCLEKIFSKLIMYYNKSLIYTSAISCRALLDTQLEILTNMREFFSEYLKNRKLSHAVLKNNKYLVERYRRLYLDIMNTSFQRNTDPVGMIEVGEVLEKVIEENGSVLHLMSKILIGIA
jgi:hypothetical protein